MNTRKLIPLILLAAGILAYHNSFRGPFIFDDINSIVENPHILRLWPVSYAMRAPLHATVDGRPVAALTLAINYAISGFDVWSYHAFNLGVHLLASLVLFALVEGSLELRGRRAPWLAGTVALLWMLHPLQTESVTYVIQRTESLMGLFFFLTLYCTMRGATRGPARPWYTATVASCVLGMGCKEVMVAAPLAVLAYDYLFLAESWRQLWQKRRALYAGLAATWVLLAWLVAATPRPSTGLGFEFLTPWDYLRTEAAVIMHYLGLVIWPHPLVIDYFDWPVVRSLVTVLPEATLLVALVAASAWGLWRRHWLGFLGAWFFLVLAPTSSVLPSPGEVAAERRMYVPLAAVIALGVIGGRYALHSILSPTVGANGMRRVEVGLVVAIAVSFGFLSVRRNDDYQDDVSIWRNTVAKRPNNPHARTCLGRALTDRRQFADAQLQFREALRLQPAYAPAHNDLGVTMMQMGRFKEAAAHFHDAVTLWPEFPEANKNLADVLAQAGRLDEAIWHYEQALRSRPDWPETLNNLGLALARQGRLEEAVTQFCRTLQLEPKAQIAESNLGLALMKLGRFDDALAHARRALDLDPHDAQARSVMGIVLEKKAHLPNAAQ